MRGRNNDSHRLLLDAEKKRRRVATGADDNAYAAQAVTTKDAVAYLAIALFQKLNVRSEIRSRVPLHSLR
jgi:hypothetical protein